MWCFENFLKGAKDQDRTGDPSLFRGMLYQLSYLGVITIQFTLQTNTLLDAYLPRQLPWRNCHTFYTAD